MNSTFIISETRGISSGIEPVFCIFINECFLIISFIPHYHSTDRSSNLMGNKSSKFLYGMLPNLLHVFVLISYLVATM